MNTGQISTRNKVTAHIVFWVITLFIVIGVWGLPYYKKENFWPFFWNQSLFHASSVFYFYANYFILVPFFLARKKYLLFTFLTLLNILLHFCFCAYFWYQRYIWEYIPLIKFGPMTYECLYYGVISIGFRMFELWNESEEYKNKLEKEVKEAELLFLQSQMSPHFLFNTLNNIYGLSLNHSPDTAKSVRELKNLMRYFEHFEKGEKIQLYNELNYLTSFIALNRLRNPAVINLVIDVSPEQQTLFVEPMLLLPFIENAFKHGALNKEISISLTVEANTVCLHVVNDINRKKRKDRIGGIGIPNVKRRLELLYPGKHALFISSDHKHYAAQLKLEVQ